MKVLILASNPRGDLNLDREIRDLRAVIEGARNRQDFEVSDALAVRVSDLQQLLFKHEPQIVHFCGHGSGRQGLVFQDDSGNEQWVQADALSELFRLFSSNVRCVLLNACYSETQANAIVNHVDYVIGMNREVQDNAAIAFSKGFYRALGYARSIEQAFEFGRNAIQLEISGGSRLHSAEPDTVRKIEVVDAIEQTPIPEHLKPILKIKPNLSSRAQGDLTRAEQSLSQDVRAEIQLAIDKSLRRVAPLKPNISATVAGVDGALLEATPASLETHKVTHQPKGRVKQSVSSDDTSFTTKIIVMLGVVGIVGMSAWLLSQRILSNSEPVVIPDPIENPEPDVIISANGINYEPLKKSLESQDWTLADEQTMSGLLKVVAIARPERDPTQTWFNSDDIKELKLACSDLKIINRLWAESTNNRLSLSTQARIWQRVGGAIETENVTLEMRERFSRSVGWQDAAKNPLDLEILHRDIENVPSEEIPEGYLPSAIGRYKGEIFVGPGNEFAALPSTLQECDAL